MNTYKSLILLLLLVSAVLAITIIQTRRSRLQLIDENHKLIIQKDSLLAEKMDYEKKFIQLLEQFDTVIKKKALDSSVIYIPKSKPSVHTK